MNTLIATALLLATALLPLVGEGQNVARPVVSPMFTDFENSS